jgi:hypothetical protein
MFVGRVQGWDSLSITNGKEKCVPTLNTPGILGVILTFLSHSIGFRQHTFFANGGIMWSVVLREALGCLGLAAFCVFCWIAYMVWLARRGATTRAELRPMPGVSVRTKE